MASEQLFRRDNTTTTDKARVPKMATHFDNLTGGKDAPQGSIEALQGGEHNKDHAGKSIGDVGGRGKARESHELGSQFESLADKVKGEDHRERVGDHAANVVGKKEGEGATRERRDVGKFEMKTEGGERGNKDREKELERQTREVKGRTEKERGRENKGPVVAEKGGVGAENEGAGGTTVIACTLETRGDTEKPREENEGISSAAEKAKCAGGTAASYVGEKAAQAKDVTVESGKSAAEYAGKVAADLKDRAVVAGWAAAHFSTEKTVEGTKAAAHVMEGAAGYAGQKAAELASKSAGAVKGLAASAGESAKEYTARKKEEAKREFEAKKASQSQEAEARPAEGIGETVSQQAQKAKPGGGTPQKEGTGSSVLSAIGDTVSSVGEKVKKPFENLMGGGEGKTESGGQEQKKREEKLSGNITERGGEVLGPVGETVSEIGQNVLKPAARVQEHGQEAKQEDGVLSAIGETIGEIAQTTRLMVAGEGEKEPKPNVGLETRVTDRAKHEGSQSARV